jgi:hypothetical protein
VQRSFDIGAGKALASVKTPFFFAGFRFWPCFEASASRAVSAIV